MSQFKAESSILGLFKLREDREFGQDHRYHDNRDSEHSAFRSLLCLDRKAAMFSSLALRTHTPSAKQSRSRLFENFRDGTSWPPPFGRFKSNRGGVAGNGSPYNSIPFRLFLLLLTLALISLLNCPVVVAQDANDDDVV